MNPNDDVTIVLKAGQLDLIAAALSAYAARAAADAQACFEAIKKQVPAPDAAPDAPATE